jgi:transposase
MLKLGLDIDREKFVVAAQYDHAMPRPPRGFAPAEFFRWVEVRLREGFEVHVVNESCGFGFGLFRALVQAGAHCFVIAPQKLDERNTRVKADGRDSRALCLRLDRYLAGNKDFHEKVRISVEP